jgi:hypothetical protein
MGIIKRIGLLLFGVLSGMVGLISIIVSIFFMVGCFLLPDRDGGELSKRIFMVGLMFVASELLLAFGITASLLGLRYILGRRDWIIRIINHFWSKAIRICVAMPLMVWGGLAIVKIVGWCLGKW